MARRVLPVALVVASAAAGGHGHQRLAFHLLVLAVPVAAVAALALYGQLVDAPRNAPGRGLVGLELALAVTGLALLLVAAGTRGAASAAAVPAVSATALGGYLGVLVTQALMAFLPAEREPA